jgi:c-di-GMP-binding flagellar brake protein YcgR
MWDGVNRRKFRRTKYPCLITMRKNSPPSAAVFTQTVNLSVGGIRVLIAKKLDVMAEVSLELDLKDMSPALFTTGVVIRSKQLFANKNSKRLRYDTGIRFTHLKDADRRRIEHIIQHLRKKTS